MIELSINNKRAQTIIRNLNNKLSYKSSEDVALLNELIVILYINGYYREIIELTKDALDIPFVLDFRVWGSMHSIYCVVCLISDDEVLIKKLKQKIDDNYHVPNKLQSSEEAAYAMHLKVKKRQTLDDILYTDHIEGNDDQSSIDSYMFVSISKLIDAIVLNEYYDLDKELLETHLNERVNHLKEVKKYRIEG